MTQHATITNTRTGQNAKFSLPFPIHQLSKIGVGENFEGELYVDGDDDTFGFGVDGYLTVEELREYLKDYENRQNPYHFDYMMLGRLRADCDYFLGHGGRYEGRLWAGNVPDQIAEMKKLWKKFPEGQKPEWLTWEEILQYERRMTEEDK